MCLLTYIPENIQPDVHSLLRGSRYNADGHGFAIVIPQFDTGSGRILVRKSMDPKGLIKEFAHLRLMYPDGPALFHSRITTDGATDLFNCHPFMNGGDKRTVIGHNGVLPRSVRPAKDDDRSDTRIFAEEVAGSFQLHTEMGRNIAAEWMGSYNKMVILTVDPVYDQYGYIINQDKGTWHRGCWYSNDSFYGWRASWGEGYYIASPSTSSTKGSEDWREWLWCPSKSCTSEIATVNPSSLFCTSCRRCSICDGSPCECHLEPAGGKDGVPSSRTGTGGTVIGGNPRNGHTVKTGKDWLEEYDRQREYQKAIEAGQQAARGIQQAEFDYGDQGVDDDKPMTKSQLEQVLALVESLNNGGEIPEIDRDDLLELLDSHELSAAEVEEIIDSFDRPSEDVPSVVDAPVGWPGEGPDPLVRTGDSEDDQDYVIHGGVKYAVS